LAAVTGNNKVSVAGPHWMLLQGAMKLTVERNTGCRSDTMKSALENTKFDKMLDNTKSDTQRKEGPV
jgi:hypothetical protein